jgi:hypothetical protein
MMRTMMRTRMKTMMKTMMKKRKKRRMRMRKMKMPVTLQLLPQFARKMALQTRSVESPQPLQELKTLLVLEDRHRTNQQGAKRDHTLMGCLPFEAGHLLSEFCTVWKEMDLETGSKGFNFLRQ